MVKHILVALVGISLLGACKNSSDDGLDLPVVSIENKILTKRDLYESIPNGLGREDSTIFAQNYIDRWVKIQLMLRMAELNLSDEEKNVEKLLDDYRTALLTHQYQQKIIEQKYTPLITSSEIEAYYTNMKDNYKLRRSLIKGLFVKVPYNAPKLDELETWCKSNRSADLIDIEAYCFQNADKYTLFIDEWRSLETIVSELPLTSVDLFSYFDTQRFYRVQSDGFIYFISVWNIIPEGELAPFEHVKNNIKTLLINKKRVEYIQTLEKDIYNEGLNEKIVKFY